MELEISKLINFFFYCIYEHNNRVYITKSENVIFWNNFYSKI